MIRARHSPLLARFEVALLTSAERLRDGIDAIWEQAKDDVLVGLVVGLMEQEATETTDRFLCLLGPLGCLVSGSGRAQALR